MSRSGIQKYIFLKAPPDNAVVQSGLGITASQFLGLSFKLTSSNNRYTKFGSTTNMLIATYISYWSIFNII